MKNIFILVLMLTFGLFAETLFEIKDSSNRPVFSISDDGMRVINNGDTMMVISTAEAKISLGASKERGLSRSFSVSTNTTSKAGITNVLEVTNDNTIMREGVLGDQYTNFSPDNIFIGLNSGINATGLNNVFVGNYTGITNSTGNKNVFVGDSTGFGNTSGVKNVFLGNRAGQLNTSGNRNISVGNTAGMSNTSGDMNICIGDGAGYDNTSNLSVFIGTNSGWKNSTGLGNTFVGNQSGVSNTTGDFNNYFGWFSGSSCSGAHNTMIGTLTGFGSYTGDYNVYIGEYAGQDNNGGSNNLFLGNNVSVTGSNKLAIDNSSTTTPLIAGDFFANALTINGTLGVTGNTSVGGTFNTTGVATFGSNAIVNGTYFRIATDPGTTTTPTNYVYQGGSTASTSKRYAFAVNDALWVTSHAYIDGNLQIQGGTAIGMTQAGILTVGTNLSANYKAVTLTFPTPFTTIPKINVTPVNASGVNDIYSVTVRNITTTNCVVLLCRVDSTTKTWGQNLKADWFAWE